MVGLLTSGWFWIFFGGFLLWSILGVIFGSASSCRCSGCGRPYGYAGVALTRWGVRPYLGIGKRVRL